MREGAVKYLKKLDYDVTVIMPNYEDKYVKKNDNIIQIPFKGIYINKVASLMERLLR